MQDKLFYTRATLPKGGCHFGYFGENPEYPAHWYECKIEILESFVLEGEEYNPVDHDLAYITDKDGAGYQQYNFAIQNKDAEILAVYRRV